MISYDCPLCNVVIPPGRVRRGTWHLVRRGLGLVSQRTDTVYCHACDRLWDTFIRRDADNAERYAGHAPVRSARRKRIA